MSDYVRLIILVAVFILALAMLDGPPNQSPFVPKDNPSYTR